MNNNHPAVGVAVIIKKDNRILLGKRIGSLATNTWGFTGGRLEFNETPENCATRETLEETGQVLRNLQRIGFTNAQFDDQHWVTLYIAAETDDEPKVMEPDKCAEWKWFLWNDLPSPLMEPIYELLEQNIYPLN